MGDISPTFLQLCQNSRIPLNLIKANNGASPKGSKIYHKAS
ncbi:MAG: hypothetical protein PUB35_06825 [Campylobacteraceae bacterium]|nr:hypothetical protein [Campylobacter sp.]MDD6162483.1 hypothetical protein [Campylobacteraceae bacterium]